MPSRIPIGLLSGEAVEGGASYRDRIVRRGEQSVDAMREKARYVLGEMERRMQALGFGWADTTATQVYTVYDLFPFLANEIVRPAPARPEGARRRMRLIPRRGGHACGDDRGSWS